jgi:hypothetical protein
MGNAVRFDDRLDTVMRQPATAESGPVLWSQLVDLLAQGGVAISAALRESAVRRLQTLAPDVPLERRRATATAIGHRSKSPALVELFARDDLRVAAPVLIGARIAGKDWANLIPRLSAPARSLLRGRRDLPEDARRALQAFGSADLVIDDAAADARAPRSAVGVPGTRSTIPISALVERIERWREARPRKPAPPAPLPPVEDRPAAFRFETGPNGEIVWQEGGRAEALIGLSLAGLAPPNGYGVDGQASGAFAKRAPIDNARLVLPDGQWRLSARPIFDEDHGRFAGYVGIARRDGSSDRAGFLPDLPPDAARQLVHELGTPLNAIRGFAEMIAGQLLGPVAEPYRARASEVVADARRLALIVDEFDAAARLDAGRTGPANRTGTALSTLREVLAEDVEPLCARRGVSLAIEMDLEGPPLAIDERDARRLIDRLASAMIGLAHQDETIALKSALVAGLYRFELDLPEGLAGHSRDALMSSALCADDGNPDAPPIGLGYTLRLIAALAQRAGGALSVEGGRCVLNIPALVDSGDALRESV